MKEHFRLLGFKVRDAVTGFEGVAESVSFDLYGCVQYVVRAEFSKDAKEETMKGHWFDAKRLTAISGAPVMSVPSFDNPPGGSEKPAYPSKPAR
jgi:hypothetical protein